MTRSGRQDAGTPARVLFVTNTPEWIGANNSLLHMVRDLGPGVRAEVTYPPDRDGLFLDELDREGIAHRAAPGLTKRDIPSFVRSIRGRFDLVYGNNGSGACINAMWAAKLARLPYIGHFRSMAPARHPYRYLPLNAADRVVAISEACAEALSRAVRIPPIHVIPNGVRLEPYSGGRPSRDWVRRELGPSGRRPIVVSVGHIMPRKAQHLAVEALHRSARRGVEYDLVLVGRTDRDAEYTARVERTASELGVADRVHLTGFRDDVPEVLSAADVCLHTALAEAFGRAVIEGMAAGLPVVAFDVDGVAEIVRDGATGYLCEPGNVTELAGRLESLVGDPDLRGQLGRAGKDRVRRQYTAERTARSVAEVIADTVGGRVADVDTGRVSGGAT